MAKATFKDLIAQTYLFDVQTPDDERLTLEMRAPSQSEVWAVEREMPPRPEPPLSGFEGTHEEGNLKPVHNPQDPGYLQAVADWTRQLQMRRILLCWTEEVPGDTLDEKLTAMDDLPNWTISALSRCASLVIVAGQVGIAGRPFRAD